MKNLKKLLAVIVAVCVLATMAVPAFAAETTLTDAEICAKLGVLLGDGGGVTDTYLAKGTERLQAAILYLRLLKLEKEASAFEGEENFDDADGVYPGGQKILAYLKAHPELGWVGVGGNKFDPKSPATAQMIYKVLLEVLGYEYGTDFTWAETIDFAATVGLSKIADVTELTNAELATALVEALKAKVKDSDKTLVEKLIEDGIVDEADAIEVGLVEEVPETLEVVSVKADNLVRVVVTFNKPIDKDSISDGDFEVDGNDIDADDVSLSDDKKVATLKIDAADYLSNGDEVTIVIDGISAVDGTTLTDYETEFTPMDTVQPKVESITFVGPETAKITFTEPIDEDAGSPEVVIDGGIYSATPASGYENSTDVTVDLGTELDEGEHTFKVKGFEDYAGYSNLVQNITVEYVAVDTAPSVTVTEATQTYVKLKFERPVKDIEEDDFYQTYSSWVPLEIQDSDGEPITDTNAYHEEIKLVFVDAVRKVSDNDDDDDRPLPVGTVKIVVKDEAVEDRWGNKNDGDVTLTADITADTTKPTVTKVTVESQKEVRVYYSEEVNPADAVDESNFTIRNSKGEKISATKWNLEYDTSNKYTAIEFNNDLDTGDYTVTVEAIADTSVSKNTLDTVTIEFTVTDKSSSLSGVTATWAEADSVLYIKYDDEMDASSVLNSANYKVGTATTTTETFDSIFDNDGDVKLTMFTSKIVKVQFRSLGTGDTLEGKYLTIGRVKDAAGNLVDEFSKTVQITEEKAPIVTGVKKIATNKFELTLNQELKSIAAGAIRVSKNGTTTEDSTSPASYKFVNDGDDTKIIVTAPSSHEHAGTEGVSSGYAIVIVADKVKSVTGVTMDLTKIVAGQAFDLNGDGNTDDAGEESLAFEDGVAPEFAKDENDDKVIYAYDADSNNKVDHFIIKYSEAISAGSVSKYTYAVDGYTVKAVNVVDESSMNAARSAISGTLPHQDGQYVIITVDELDDADIDQTPEVTQKQSIEDVHGNELAAQKPIKAISAEDAYLLNP